MPSKFDEYLNEGGFTQADRDAVKAEKAQNVERNSAPTPVADADKVRPNAPQPDLNQETKDRIESTQEGPGNNHEQQSESKPVTKDSLAAYDNSQDKEQPEPPAQEQEQDQER